MAESESQSVKAIVSPETIDQSIAQINLKEARKTWDMTNFLADEQPYLFKFVMAAKDYYPDRQDFEYLLGAAMVIYDAFRRDNPEPAFVSAHLIADCQKENFEFFNSMRGPFDKAKLSQRINTFLKESRQGPLLKFAYSHSIGNTELPKPYQSSMFSMLKVMIDSLDRAE